MIFISSYPTGRERGREGGRGRETETETERDTERETETAQGHPRTGKEKKIERQTDIVRDRDYSNLPQWNCPGSYSGRLARLVCRTAPELWVVNSG